MNLTPKNWSTFQHYKDRKPPWIKLHRGLLDDYQFACLPLASQALAPRLWLLASEYSDGKITASIQEIAFRLHVTVQDLEVALKPLVDAEFFADASGALAVRKQEARLEIEIQVETEEEEEGEGEAALRAHAPAVIPDVSREIRPKPKRAKARVPIPDDWKTGEPEIAHARSLGFTDPMIASMAEAFSNHHRAKGSLMADWLSAWRTWCANEIKFQGSPANGYRGPRPLQDDSKSISAAAGRLEEAAKRGEFTFGPRPQLLPEPNESPVFLLSKR